MTSKFKKLAKTIIAMSIVLCCVAGSMVCLADDALGTVEIVKPSVGVALDDSIPIFQDYLEEKSDAAYPDASVTAISEEVTLKSKDTFTAPITVEQAGLYAIELEYKVLKENTQVPSVSVSLNGEVPYYEAYNIALHQSFSDERVAVDSSGAMDADYIPLQNFETRYIKDYLIDTSGYYGNRLYFYLDESVTSVGLYVWVGDVAIKSLTFCQYDAPVAYKDADLSNGKDYDGEALYFEAENAKFKSSSSIYPVNDSSSPGVSPTSPKTKYANSIGGQMWEDMGEYVEWDFEVPQDGYYNLTFKYRQNDVVGMSSGRRILIDGKVPYAEMEGYDFDYTPTYLNETLSADGKNMKIYLTKGKHNLKMQVILGDLSEILSKINRLATDLATDYRSIIMITGSTVDTLRDYNLEEYIPEIFESFEKKADELYELADKLEKLMGNSTGTKNLRVTAEQLDYCREDGYYITQELAGIKSNIAAINAWLVDAKTQPVKLDYFVLSAPDSELKAPEPNFFKTVVYHVKAFLFTFSEDYDQNAIAKSDDKMEITIWDSGNSTQYNIEKQQIERTFEPMTGITVNFRLSPGEFNMAILSGKGPDASSGSPMTLAFRNRVLDLNQFDDVEEIKARFRPSALVPLSYKDKLYGIPIGQGINVTYFRTDILEEMGLEVPKTWDDVTYVMATLQKNNLEMGVNGFFDDILYQHGGDYYDKDLTKCTLDSPEAIEAFTQYTSYFTEYGAPLTYDQLNRFRTGEMPIIFANFAFATTLLNLAPEISGRWAMAEIPCTEKADGTYDHSTVSASGGWFILNEKKKEACWEYIKWITSTDTIVENTRLNVAAMDETVRGMPANIEAFYKVGWPEEMLNLARVHEDGRLITVPAVPGNYMMSRNYSFAFNNVVYDDAVPADAIKAQIKGINDEIARKRKEFGFLTAEQ